MHRSFRFPLSPRNPCASVSFFLSVECWQIRCSFNNFLTPVPPHQLGLASLLGAFHRVLTYAVMAQVPAVFDRVPTVFHRVLTGMLSGQFINTRLRDTAEEARVVDRHISVTHEDGCGCSAKDSWHLCRNCICHHCVGHGSTCCRDPLNRQLAPMP